MRQGMGILLPVLAIKFHHRHGRWPGVQAVDVDINPIGIGTWNIKRLDATNPAKTVLGHPTVKGVGLQLLLPGEQAELAAGNDQVQVTGFGTDRAIAILDLDIRIGLNFKLYGATVAASLVEHG